LIECGIQNFSGESRFTKRGVKTSANVVGLDQSSPEMENAVSKPDDLALAKVEPDCKKKIKQSRKQFWVCIFLVFVIGRINKSGLEAYLPLGWTGYTI
jgi:hypothetical protein